MSTRDYIVYGGRAMAGSTADASILEALGEYPTKEDAIREATECWGDTEYVLCSYLLGADGRTLTDERQEHYHPAPGMRARRNV